MPWLLSLYLLSGLSFANPPALTVEVYNIEKAEGNLCLAIYDEAAHFPGDEGGVLYRAVPITSAGELTIDLPPLADDKTYAIAIYQDLNGNQKLDTNLMGIPKEPYGFSNNPRVKWQEPTFLDAAFVPSASQGQVVRVKLASWEDQ